MSTDNRPYGDLADLVRRTRRAVEMTQRQLSSALGKSEGYVGHLESGRFQPTVETLKALASVFGITLEKHGFLGRADAYATIAGTSRPGVFVAGAATGPETIDDSIAQAQAAAIAALAVVRGTAAAAAE